MSAISYIFGEKERKLSSEYSPYLERRCLSYDVFLYRVLSSKRLTLFQHFVTVGVTTLRASNQVFYNVWSEPPMFGLGFHGH